MKNIKQYYKHLGRLVYAVAIADGNVQEEERNRLHDFVIKELASHESSSDSSGMNKAFYVDFEFENSEEQHPGLAETLLLFNHFISDNFEAGDDELLERSLKLLESVAEAYTRRRERNIIESVKERVKEISNSGKHA